MFFLFAFFCVGCVIYVLMLIRHEKTIRMETQRDIAREVPVAKVQNNVVPEVPVATVQREIPTMLSYSALSQESLNALPRDIRMKRKRTWSDEVVSNPSRKVTFNFFETKTRNFEKYINPLKKMRKTKKQKRYVLNRDEMEVFSFVSEHCRDKHSSLIKKFARGSTHYLIDFPRGSQERMKMLKVLTTVYDMA